MQLPVGTRLLGGKYKIEKGLGQGGFGITYLAEQTGLGRKVAVKEFFMKEHCNRETTTSHVSVPSVGSRELVSRFRDKFMKEAGQIASFENPHIVRIIDVFEDNGTAYYVMEYLYGKNLEALVREQGALSEAVAVKYIRNIADALAEVHANSFLHLDVKPANVMLNKKGEAVLIDFGISKHYDDSGSQTSSALIGVSEGYAPIEQYEAGALDNFTPATDIYALGATFYFLLTGKRPPKASDVMNDGLPEFPSNISPALRSAVEKAMQSRRKDRPQSIMEFLDSLTCSLPKEKSNVVPDVAKNRILADDAATEIVAVPADDLTAVPSAQIPPPPLSGISGNTATESVRKSDVGYEKPKKSKAPFFMLLFFFLAVMGGGAWFLLGEYGGSGGNGNDVAEEVITNPAIVAAQRFLNDPSKANYVAVEVAGEGLNEAQLQEFAEWIMNHESEIERAVSCIDNELPSEFESAKDSSAYVNFSNYDGMSNGVMWVDLGLPSGIKWATHNVGAPFPEFYGNYYAWGEVAAKENYISNNCDTYGKDMYDISGDYGYDVARNAWNSFRIPTLADFQELIDYCTWTWIEYEGVKGYKVTGGNGKSIFLPATGCYYGTSNQVIGTSGSYWCSTPDDSNTENAHFLLFDDDNYSITSYHRYYGRSIRPVMD